MVTKKGVLTGESAGGKSAFLRKFVSEYSPAHARSQSIGYVCRSFGYIAKFVP